MPSRATQIREAIITRLSGQPWLPVNGLRRQARPQLQDSDLPALLVVIADETQSPEDEANCGPPRYITEVTIGISYCIGYQGPEALDDGLDDATAGIRDRLLTDPTFVRGVDPSKSRDDPEYWPLFEAITKIRRGRLFAQEGAGYFAEGRLELTFQFREDYEPVIPDELDFIVIDGRPSGAGPGTPGVNLKIATPTS